jgi:hypothetical protein
LLLLGLLLLQLSKLKAGKCCKACRGVAAAAAVARPAEHVLLLPWLQSFAGQIPLLLLLPSRLLHIAYWLQVPHK